MIFSDDKFMAFYNKLESLRNEVEKHRSSWIAHQSYKNKCSELFFWWLNEIRGIVSQMEVKDEVIKRIDELLYELYENSRKKVSKATTVRKILINVSKIFLLEILPKTKKSEPQPLHEFFSKLKRILGPDFDIEIKDLELVYDKSGTCTAFLLRKILEKSLFLALVRSGFKEENLKDEYGKYVGLDRLLNIAYNSKVDGLPLLTPNTVKNIRGIKFLGDAAAHNYLANVDMEEIKPQIPYILVALKELARCFRKENNS